MFVYPFVLIGVLSEWKEIHGVIKIVRRDIAFELASC